jgi:hypothetical protein
MARKSADRVLILGKGVHAGPSGELLTKMVASLQAPQDRVTLMEAGDDFEPARLKGFRVCVILGEDLGALHGWKRVGFQDWNGVRVIVTESLEDLLQRPALKRSAWEDLKRVMQEMGW